MKIIYHAPSPSLGDTTEQQAIQYRALAAKQIKAAYLHHDVSVLDKNAGTTAYTNDEDNKEAIIDFCSRLWDRAQDAWD